MVGTGVVSVVIAAFVGVAVVASYGFAWYSWDSADHPVSDRFALLMFADGTWALLTLVEMLSPTDALALVWAAPVALSASLVAVLWFLFVIEYTGDSEWMPDIVDRLLVGQSLVYGGLYVLNPGNVVYTTRGVARYGVLRLAYEEFGQLLVAELLLIYGLLLVTFVLLGRFFVRTRNLYRKQTGVIFGVTLVVALANVAYFAGFTPHPRLDLTPVFFVVQAAGIGVALYRYDFLNVTPLAANTLLEEIADPVFVVDQDGRVVDRNRAADRYVDSSTTQPTLSDVTITGLDEVLTSCDGGERTTDLEVTTTQRQHDRLASVTYDVRTTPITDRYDIVRGYAVVLRDVTERKARKQALETQNERLEEFTGIVSHDLRNPLQVIDGKVELARQTGEIDHLDDASEAVSRMETMLEELLHLAREGQTIDEKTTVALDACCRVAWEAVGTETATLVVETEETVLADETRLRQVFENLFRNSVEHGGEDVTVTVGSFENGFYVADDGPGIPDDADVFELGMTTEDDGTGFGLAIVERIVEAHGWTIEYVESETGGARFEVTDLYPSVLAE